MVDVPLLSVFGASKRCPLRRELQAIFDRFLLRVRSEHLDAYHFQGARPARRPARIERLVPEAGHGPFVLHPRPARGPGRDRPAHADGATSWMATPSPWRSRSARRASRSRTAAWSSSLEAHAAASAFFDGRPAADISDLFIPQAHLEHPGAGRILDGIVPPVLDGWFPDNARRGARARWRWAPTPSAEMQRIKATLTSGAPVSDLQLFAHMRALGEIKAALQSLATDPARQTLARAFLDQPMEHRLPAGPASRVAPVVCSPP